MSGTVFRRCACRDDAGKQLGAACAKLATDRKHGLWYFQVRVPGRTSPHRRGGFERKADATAAMNALRDRLARGVENDDRQTTGEWLTTWLAGKRTLRPTTQRSYEMHLRLYLIPSLGAIPLERLRPVHVSTMLDTIDAGPQTVRRVHATLRSALNAAVKQRRLVFNPAVHVELPMSAQPKVHPWEPEELGRFLDSTGGDRLGALYELIAMTGLRRGEACGLRWIDVDLDRRVLYVRQQIVQLGHATMIGRPKTASGEDRRVDLDETTVGALLAHKLAQDTERALWGPAYQDSGLVFTREDGSHLHPEYVTRHFRLLCKRAGLRPIRLHDLRHGQASLMLAAGVAMAVVSKRLGHSSTAITADTYSHLLKGVGRAAADAAAAMVPRSTPRVPTTSSQGPENDSGPPPEGTKGQVSGGAPPGTRTPNPRIESRVEPTVDDSD
jgi:integrase